MNNGSRLRETTPVGTGEVRRQATRVQRGGDAYERVTDALRAAGMKVTESSSGARSQCPSHGSRGLTLAVRRNPKNPDGPLHVTCFAGCETEDVLAELGLGLRDLYEDKGRQRGSRTPSRPRPKPSPWDKLDDIDHFCARAVQQEALEASPEYQEHLADLAEWAKPRPGDYTAGPSGDWGI